MHNGMLFLLCLCAGLAALATAPAAADYVIAPAGGDITGAQLSAALAAGNVDLRANVGDILVNDAVSWSTHKLTLTAANHVSVNRTMTASGTAALTLSVGGRINMGLRRDGFAGRLDFTGAPGLNRYIVNDQVYTLIYDAAALQAINISAPGMSYALAKDVDLGGIANFIPLGSVSTAFSGRFDGLGHEVRHLTISGNADYVGLFGRVASGGVVRNLGVSGMVKGANRVGGLAGQTDAGASLSNVYARVAVSGSDNPYPVNNVAIGNTFLGGLIGYNIGAVDNAWASGNVSGGHAWNVELTGFFGGLAGANNGSLRHVWASGAVQGRVTDSYRYDDVGGLVGYNDAVIEHAYASGSVAGNVNVGGLLGRQLTAPLSKVYATGRVSGYNNTGGLVGYCDGVTVSDVYASGEVVGVILYAGGVIGFNRCALKHAFATGGVYGPAYNGGVVGTNSGTGTLESNFWNIEAINVYYGVGDNQTITDARAAALPLENLKQRHTFFDAGWDIADAGGSGNVWRIYEGNSLPLLRDYLAPLTLTADSAVPVVYDGATHTGPGTWTAIPADYDISQVLGTGAVAGSYIHAGTHALALYGLYSTQSGYDIASVPGTLTIRPAPLTVTPTGGQHKTYGTDDPPAGFAYSYHGAIGGDAAGLAGNLGRAAGETVGSHAFALGSLRAGNSDYVAVFGTDTAALEITPATATVLPDSGQFKAQGSADPSLTYAVSGLLDAAAPRYWNVAGSYGTAAAITDTAVSGALARVAGESAGEYDFTLGSLDAGSNYALAVATNAPTFTIYAPPTLTALAPAFGPATGATAVTLTGTDFVSGATTVTFGANAATSVTVTSATSLVATAPPGAAGMVEVTVTTPGGTGETSAAGRYTYRTDLLLSAGITGGDGFAAYGSVVHYDIVIGNSGSQDAGDIVVVATVPEPLDAAQASWVCLDADTGACRPQGSGALHDIARVPVQGSVRYRLAAPVRIDATGDAVHASVSATGPYDDQTASASSSSVLVLFRDGMEE